MELQLALRTTGAVRKFTDQSVDDNTIASILEMARFAPSGGNRQGWHVVVIRDPDQRRAIRDLYLTGWYEYLAMASAGLVPFAPITDRDAERQALSKLDEIVDVGAGSFAEHLDRVPVLLVVLADLRSLAATDRDLDRYTLVGGASIYPFVWSILLAARGMGLAGVSTTMLTRREDNVRATLRVPDHFAVAAGIALGHPVKQSTHLRRAEVPDFTTYDYFDGLALPMPDEETGR